MSARGTALALLLTVAGAFLLRLAPFLGLPPGSGFPILESDPLNHLHLAQLIRHDYPRVPGFDYYINFPLGAESPWPFLYDFTTATVARFLGLGEEGLQVVCYFFPAVLGSLALPLSFLLARSLGFTRAFSAWAAFLSSLVPVQVQYTFAGNYDHHAADQFLFLLFLLCLLESWKGRTSDSLRGRSLLAHAGITTATLLLSFNWLGAVAYPALFLLAAFLSLLAPPRDPLLANWLHRSALSFAAASLSFPVIISAAYGPGRLARIKFDEASLFQPLFLFAVASGLFFLGASLKKGRGKVRAALLLLPGAAFLAAFFLLLPSGVLAISTYLSGKTPGISLWPEFIPSFFAGEDGLRLSFSRGVGLLSWGVFLVPLALVAVWRGWWRREDGGGLEAFPRSLLMVLLGGLSLLALWQPRWGNVYAVSCGLAGGMILSLTWGWAGRKGDCRLKAFAGGTVLAITLAFLFPCLGLARFRWEHPFGGMPAYPLAPTLEWLKADTPVSSDYYRPSDPPAYGVLALPLEGAGLVALGRRPAMATPFQGAFKGGLWRASLGFFLETGPTRAKAFMETHRLRYLLLHAPEVVEAAVHGLLWPKGEVSPGLPPVSEVLWRFAGSSYQGREGPVEGAPFWRLVWEDEQPDGEGETTVPVKLFELVPGAVLGGSAPPGSWVSARLTLRTRLRPEVPWQGVVRADARGRYSLVVPYPTEGPSGTTRPLGPYWVEVRGREPAAVTVGEEDVMKGRKVEVP